MKRKQRNGYLLVGGILAGFLAAVILLGLFWTPYDPAAMSVGPKLACLPACLSACLTCLLVHQAPVSTLSDLQWGAVA